MSDLIEVTVSDCTGLGLAITKNLVEYLAQSLKWKLHE